MSDIQQLSGIYKESGFMRRDTLFRLAIVLFLLTACQPNSPVPIALQLTPRLTIPPTSKPHPTSIAISASEVAPTATVTSNLIPTPTLEPRRVYGRDFDLLHVMALNDKGCARMAIRLEKGIGVEDLLAISGDCYGLGISDPTKMAYLIAADVLYLIFPPFGGEEVKP
jgi:hypothetical protein